MIEIYGKSGCSGCSEAKQLCEMKGVSYKYLTLGSDYQLKEFLEVSGGKHKSFPMITSDGNYLGGLQELKNILK
ncbi:putative glutaredoxin [Acinetobacter phage Phab24]|nr:putative glutaredoxin [Acinetobacter phage Phab24]